MKRFPPQLRAEIDDVALWVAVLGVVLALIHSAIWGVR